MMHLSHGKDYAESTSRSVHQGVHEAHARWDPVPAGLCLIIVPISEGQA